MDGETSKQGAERDDRDREASSEPPSLDDVQPRTKANPTRKPRNEREWQEYKDKHVGNRVLGQTFLIFIRDLEERALNEAEVRLNEVENS